MSSPNIRINGRGVHSLEQIRQVSRNSTRLIVYEPGDIGPWDEAYERFVKMLQEQPDRQLPSDRPQDPA